jgi:hypothetical protein
MRPISLVNIYQRKMESLLSGADFCPGQAPIKLIGKMRVRPLIDSNILPFRYT